MWGDLGWFSEFVDAIIDTVRGWFSGLNAGSDVKTAFDKAQDSFRSWIDAIVTGNIRDFLK